MKFRHLHSIKEVPYGLFTLHVQLDFTIGVFLIIIEIFNTLTDANQLKVSRFTCILESDTKNCLTILEGVQKGRIMKKFLKSFVICCMAVVLVFPVTIFAANGPYTDVVIKEAFSQIYQKEIVQLSGIRIKYADGTPVNTSLELSLYNTTTQEYCDNIISSDGVLATTNLVKGQHYLLSLKNADFEMSNKYFTLDKTGELPKDDKTKEDNNSADRSTFDSLVVTERAQSLTSEELKKVNRIPFCLEADGSTGKFVWEVYGDSKYPDSDDFSPSDYNVTFKLISQYDTVELTVDENEFLQGDMLEDVNYTLVMESSDPKLKDYVVLQNLVTTKNHQERGANVKTSTYTHYTCNQVAAIYIADGSYSDGKDFINNATYAPISSYTGKSSLMGIRAFVDGNRVINGGANANEFVFNERVLESNDDKLLMDFDTINMHRYEICKIPQGDYTIVTEIPANKTVASVYNVDLKGNKVEDCTFNQDGKSLSINTTNLSLYNTVIEFEHVHDLELILSVESTCTTAGHKAYYKCTRCNKIFSDENGINELNLTDVELPMLEHLYIDGKCKLCGAEKEVSGGQAPSQNGEHSDNNENKSVNKPGTGDNSNYLMWALLALTSAGGFITIVVKRKKS